MAVSQAEMRLIENGFMPMTVREKHTVEYVGPDMPDNDLVTKFAHVTNNTDYINCDVHREQGRRTYLTFEPPEVNDIEKKPSKWQKALTWFEFFSLGAGVATGTLIAMEESGVEIDLEQRIPLGSQMTGSLIDNITLYQRGDLSQITESSVETPLDMLQINKLRMSAWQNSDNDDPTSFDIYLKNGNVKYLNESSHLVRLTESEVFYLANASGFNGKIPEPLNGSQYLPVVYNISTGKERLADVSDVDIAITLKRPSDRYVYDFSPNWFVFSQDIGEDRDDYVKTYAINRSTGEFRELSDRSNEDNKVHFPNPIASRKGNIVGGYATSSRMFTLNLSLEGQGYDIYASHSMTPSGVYSSIIQPAVMNEDGSLMATSIEVGGDEHEPESWNLTLFTPARGPRKNVGFLPDIDSVLYEDSHHSPFGDVAITGQNVYYVKSNLDTEGSKLIRYNVTTNTTEEILELTENQRLKINALDNLLSITIYGNNKAESWFLALNERQIHNDITLESITSNLEHNFIDLMDAAVGTGLGSNIPHTDATLSFIITNTSNADKIMYEAQIGDETKTGVMEKIGENKYQAEVEVDINKADPSILGDIFINGLNGVSSINTIEQIHNLQGNAKITKIIVEEKGQVQEYSVNIEVPNLAESDDWFTNSAGFTEIYHGCSLEEVVASIDGKEIGWRDGQIVNDFEPGEAFCSGNYTHPLAIMINSVPQTANVQEIIRSECNGTHNVTLLYHTPTDIRMVQGRDINISFSDYHSLMYNLDALEKNKPGVTYGINEDQFKLQNEFNNSDLETADPYIPLEPTSSGDGVLGNWGLLFGVGGVAILGAIASIFKRKKSK